MFLPPAHPWRSDPHLRSIFKQKHVWGKKKNTKTHIGCGLAFSVSALSGGPDFLLSVLHSSCHSTPPYPLHHQPLQPPFLRSALFLSGSLHFFKGRRWAWEEAFSRGNETWRRDGQKWDKLPQAPQPRSHTTLSASATPPLFAASLLLANFFSSQGCIFLRNPPLQIIHCIKCLICRRISLELVWCFLLLFFVCFMSFDRVTLSTFWPIIWQGALVILSEIEF